MPNADIDDVLHDPRTSPWLYRALTAALECDIADVAADAAALAKILERRLAQALRKELCAESNSSEIERSEAA